MKSIYRILKLALITVLVAPVMLCLATIKTYWPSQVAFEIETRLRSMARQVYDVGKLLAKALIERAKNHNLFSIGRYDPGWMPT